MRIYLAGRIRNVPNYSDIFAEAADKLRIDGHDVFNCAATNQEGRPLNKIMAFLLPQLCESDAIALIPGWWKRFGGSWIEWMLARYLSLRIIYL